MSLLATRDSIDTPPASVAAARRQTHLDAVWIALQANAVPLFFCAAFWALTHPYARIIHDARIYIDRVMADLDPAGLGRDLMFVHDGQFAFSLFPLLIRGLVAHLGPGASAKILSGLGCLSSFTAVLVLATQLVKGRAVWLLLVFACAPARLRLAGFPNRGDVGGAAALR